MKKVLIIIPIVIIVAAATVLGLFAAGIIGHKSEEPVAQAYSNSATEVVYFGDRQNEDESTWTPVNVGITVSDQASSWIPYWENEE